VPLTQSSVLVSVHVPVKPAGQVPVNVFVDPETQYGVQSVGKVLVVVTV